MSDLVTQAEWASRLGISVSTFREWRRQGRIPMPLVLPGWPRWSAQTVAKVTFDLAREGRYFRTAVVRRQSQRHRQSRASRSQQGQGPLHRTGVSEQAIGHVHATDSQRNNSASHRNSIVGAR